MKNRTKGKRRRPWKETRVSLACATAVVLDGPGSDWLLIVRGERKPPAGMKRVRS
jgi:hypothetical protein